MFYILTFPSSSTFEQDHTDNDSRKYADMFGEIKLENSYCFLLYDEAGLTGDGLVAADDGEVDAFSPAGNI